MMQLGQKDIITMLVKTTLKRNQKMHCFTVSLPALRDTVVNISDLTGVMRYD
jgi:hypothetical protein